MKTLRYVQKAALCLAGLIACGSLRADAMREIDSRAVLSADAVSLADGDALKLASTAFAPTADVSLAGWAEDVGRWTLAGAMSANETLYHAKAWPYQPQVAGEDLIVSDDGAQRQTVIYNDPFFAADRWHAGMSVSLELPGDSKYVTTEGWGQTYAGGLFVGLQPFGTTNRTTSAQGIMPGAYGFTFLAYSGSLLRVRNGATAGANMLAGTGIDIHRPFALALGCTNRVLTLAIEQSGKRLVVSDDLSAAYRDSMSYLTIGVGTDFWGWKTTMPWMYTRLSGFNGCVGRTDPATLADDPAGYPSATLWTTFGTTKLSKGNVQLISASQNAKGGALCRKLLKVGQLLEFECDLNFGKNASGTDHGNGLSFVLQPGTNGLAMAASSVNYVPINAVGLVWGYYSNKTTWLDRGVRIEEKAHGIALAKNSVQHVKLTYDGLCRITITFTQGESTVTRTHFFPEMLGWGTMRFGIWGAASNSWNCYLETTVANVALRTPSAESYCGVEAAGDVVAEASDKASLAFAPVPGTVSYPAEDGFSFAAANWVLASHASIKSNGSYIHLLESWSTFTASALAKKAVSSANPLRIAYRVKTGAAHNTMGQAGGVSLCLKPLSSGCALSATAGQSHPAADQNALGFVINYYDKTMGWHEAGSRVDMEAVPFGVSPNSAYDIEVRHDGAGTLTAVVSCGGQRFATSRFFQRLKDMGEDMYVGVSGSTSTTGAAMETDLAAFSLGYETVGAIPAGHLAAALDSITLRAGASLGVCSAQGMTAASVRQFVVAGTSELACSNVQLSVGRIVVVGEPSTLTLNGAAVVLADPLEIVLPAAWRKAFPVGQKVVAFGKGASLVLPKTVTVAYDDGSPCRVMVRVTENGVWLVNLGTIMLVR